MKNKRQVQQMLERIESLVQFEDRGPLIMALEWVLGGGISTSLDLEAWLAEQEDKS